MLYHVISHYIISNMGASASARAGGLERASASLGRACIYIYIYIEREREIDIMYVYTHVRVYVYIYIYIVWYIMSVVCCGGGRRLDLTCVLHMGNRDLTIISPSIISLTYFIWGMGI